MKLNHIRQKDKTKITVKDKGAWHQNYGENPLNPLRGFGSHSDNPRLVGAVYGIWCEQFRDKTTRQKQCDKKLQDKRSAWNKQEPCSRELWQVQDVVVFEREETREKCMFGNRQRSRYNSVLNKMPTREERTNGE